MNQSCRLLHLVPCLLLLLFTGCAPQPVTITREPAILRLVAVDSCGPLVEELAGAYEDAHPWVTVQIQVFNSSVAERALREGEVDLALLPWMQESTYEDPLWSQVFAHDGIAVITHPATPLSETGLAYLNEVFRGRIQEWGGMVLTVVSREDGSGTRRMFDEKVLGIHKVTHTAVVMPSSEAVIEYVARTPGAIGYVSTLRLGQPAAINIRVLPVEGISPTVDAISDTSYPLSRSLYLATPAEPTGEAREFAQWVLRPGGQAIVGRSGDW